MLKIKNLENYESLGLMIRQSSVLNESIKTALEINGWDIVRLIRDKKSEFLIKEFVDNKISQDGTLNQISDDIKKNQLSGNQIAESMLIQPILLINENLEILFISFHHVPPMTMAIKYNNVINLMVTHMPEFDYDKPIKSQIPTKIVSMIPISGKVEDKLIVCESTLSVDITQFDSIVYTPTLIIPDKMNFIILEKMYSKDGVMTTIKYIYNLNTKTIIPLYNIYHNILSIVSNKWTYGNCISNDILEIKLSDDGKSAIETIVR